MTTKCLRCGTDWENPTIDQNQWGHLAEVAQNGNAILFKETIMKIGGVDALSAKSILLHFVRQFAVCNHCGSSLEREGLTACQGCGGANYNYGKNTHKGTDQ